jgi:integrase
LKRLSHRDQLSALNPSLLTQAGPEGGADSRRTVMLADAVVTALRAHRTGQRMDRLVSGSGLVDLGQVFTTMHGTPYRTATITRAFQAALAAKLPCCRFHDLRPCRRHVSAGAGDDAGGRQEPAGTQLDHADL